MKINIPKITRDIDLAQYAGEFEGAVIKTWVNPPRKIANQYLVFSTKTNEARRVIADEKSTQEEKAAALEKLSEAGNELTNWLVEIWSQDKDKETHWEKEDLEEFRDHSLQTDPVLWRWVVNETIDKIIQHRKDTKKE